MPVLRFHVPVRAAPPRAPRAAEAAAAAAAVKTGAAEPEAQRRKRRRGGGGNDAAKTAGDAAAGGAATATGDEARQEIHDEELREDEAATDARRAVLPVSLCLSELDWLAATAGAGSSKLVQEPDTPTFEQTRDIVLLEAAKLLTAAMADARSVAPAAKDMDAWPKITRKEGSVNKWNRAEKRCVELNFASVRAELTLTDFKGEYYVDNDPVVAYRVSAMVSYS